MEMDQALYSSLDYRAFLRARTAELKGAGQFNLRAFARRAGIRAPGYLKMVIEGRRNLTMETAEKFCRALALTGRAREYFLALVRYNQTRDPDLKREYLDRLDSLRPRKAHYITEKSQLRYFSRPHYVCVREMAALKEFREDPKWIARRCCPRISVREAKEALDTLVELGMLARDRHGRLRQTEDFVQTEDINTKAAEAYHFHEAMLDRARHALAHLPQEERNYYALTIPMSRVLFHEIIQDFYVFRDRILEKVARGGKRHDEVFQVNFQLFPLTRRGDEDGETKGDTTAVAKKETGKEG